uniref:Uncharacterized protein n=1 Tax=Trichuris muris TaxID=70415 RepID=A0A5S6QCZ4_TRIMR
MPIVSDRPVCPRCRREHRLAVDGDGSWGQLNCAVALAPGAELVKADANLHATVGSPQVPLAAAQLSTDVTKSCAILFCKIPAKSLLIVVPSGPVGDGTAKWGASRKGHVPPNRAKGKRLC